MGSIAARQVAKEVVEKVRKGEKINLGKIQRAHGYSKKSAISMKATATKSYKEVINPVVKAMMVERDRAIEAMAIKLPKAKYRDVVDAADKLTKNIQLLTGGKTDNSGIEISWE